MSENLQAQIDQLNLRLQMSESLILTICAALPSETAARLIAVSEKAIAKIKDDLAGSGGSAQQVDLALDPWNQVIRVMKKTD